MLSWLLQALQACDTQTYTHRTSIHIHIKKNISFQKGGGRGEGGGGYEEVRGEEKGKSTESEACILHDLYPDRA